VPGASLTRRVRFHATHRYHKPDWTERQNVEAFGACASPEPHAHDYVCEVTVGGPIDPHRGMVMDLGELDRILDEQVVRPLDGGSVNTAFEEFAPGRLIPTCEELARLLAQRVEVALRAVGARARVHRVLVAEDDTLSASWSPER
jgi:6-pyruvoyltetrahydropterin/6-carboxytetrahydropterin synthase